MKTLTFTKSVATGNDFIIVDDRRKRLPARPAELARQLCDRRRAIGADGLLVVGPSAKADFRMRIFNPDGSEAEMCGNGSRCVALYARTKKIAPAHMSFETRAGIIEGTVQGDLVKVKLSDPKDIKWNLCLMIDRCPYTVDVINTGVPHVIHFVNDIDTIDVKNLGKEMRYHEAFSPAGSNVDFVKIDGKNTIRVRTYERGVEDETLACGTGAVASAIIAAEAEKMTSPVTVRTQSGEKLTIYFETAHGGFKNVYLEGEAALVFEGTIVL